MNRKLSISRQLTGFSAFAKAETHLTKQTTHGAIVTVLGAMLAMVLFCHEIGSFYSQRITKMSVDLERRHQLPVNLDVTFPSVPCAVMALDVLDISGTSESDVNHAKGMDIHKHRLDSKGRPIGKKDYITPQSEEMVNDPMFGGAVVNINIQQALKHLQDMEDEDGNHEGCRVTGSLLLNRVAGRIHLAVHQNMLFRMVPMLLQGHHLPKVLNMSHHVHELSFGPHYPGLVNPLDGFHNMIASAPEGEEPDWKTFKYFIKVVPTEYHGRLGRVTETHQYSVNEFVAPIPGDGSQFPGVDIQYDVSPIVVHVNDRAPSFLHFIVRICAVIGGVFAVTRMTDQFVHWVLRLAK